MFNAGDVYERNDVLVLKIKKFKTKQPVQADSAPDPNHN
jgi:hypothetical protein